MKRTIAALAAAILLSPAFAEAVRDPSADEDLPVFEGEELTIVGTPETTQAVKSVSRREIEKLAPADLPSLMEKAFNLSVYRSGSYGNEAKINVRGMDGKRVAVLVDGVPVNSAQSGYFDLSTIDVNSIEKVEVVYGGSDTKYNVSGAVGGVVNIVTVKKHRPGYGLRAGISNRFYFPDRYYLGWGGERKYSKPADLLDSQGVNVDFGTGGEDVYWTFSAAGNRAGNHFVYRDESGVKRRRVDNEIEDASASTTLSAVLPNYARLIASARAGASDKSLPGVMTSTTVGKERTVFTKESVMLDADRVGSDKVDTEVVLSHGYDSIDYEDPSSDSLHRLHTMDFINRWGWYAGEKLLFRAGGDFQYALLDSNGLGRVRDASGGLYAALEISADRLLVVPSLKAVARKSSAPVPIPKLGLVYRADDELILKNNYYRTFRFPALNELYWPSDATAAGNPDLDPEDGFGADFTVSYAKKDLFSLESSVYVSYHRDAISWYSVGGKWRPQNVGEAWYFGSEHSLKSGFDSFVSLSLNYAFLLTYVLTDDLGWKDDKRIPYQPVHTFSLGIEFAWKSGSLTFSERYASERFTTVDNVTRLDPYFTMDVDLVQRIGIYSLLFSIKNAFGADYRLVDGYPMPGCSVHTGLKVTYGKE